MITGKWCAAVAATLLAQASPAMADRVGDAVEAPDRAAADVALDDSRQPGAVLRFAAPQPGDVVADFMAGSGYYTALLAKLVAPHGMVYAINPTGFHDPDVWQARLEAQGNVRVMPVAPEAMLLAPASVDMIFTHLVFHDLYWESERFNFPRLDEKRVLANWFAALRPGGHVIVVDHVGPPGDPREVTERLHRIAPGTVVAAMRAAGFEMVGQSDALRRSDDDVGTNVFDESVRGKTDRFIMKFRKPN